MGTEPPSVAASSAGSTLPGGEGRVAVVTGAGSGIGRATAVVLAREGYRVALVGRREGPLGETAGMIEGEGGGAVVLVADMEDGAQAAGVVDRVMERLGGLDVLVNNAGYAPSAGIGETSAGVIERAYRVNALAPALAIARAWPVFVRQGRGCIVNVSTMGTRDPFPGFFAYAAAKAAVNVMAMSCAKEGAAHGIRAFAVAPGAVETPMLRSLFPESVLPRERCLSPGDVAGVIAACVRGDRDAENGGTIFLASP